ncbi:MAG: PhoU domain-containing protein [Candidatus Aenigmatarchaeota archaeon]
MDVRNIQKSGNAYYVYLPTSWCKQNNVSPKSKISFDMSSKGNLVVSPYISETHEKMLNLKIPENDMFIINMFIAGAYINPVKSFTIQLDKEVKSLDIVDHKKILSGVELVEFDNKKISCESVVSIEDPDLVIGIMTRKLVAMINSIINNESKELIEKYEDEIDRSKILVYKSVVSSMMFKRVCKLRHIELLYIMNIARDLEAIGDHLIEASEKNKIMLKELLQNIKTLDNTIKNINQQNVLNFLREVKSFSGKHNTKYGSHMKSIGESLVDWLITNMI